MKLRITTILSLAGVLSAGSAAALVNNQVLHRAEGSSNNEVVIHADATATGLASNSATQIYSSALTATQVMFQVGSAGVVIIDTAGNVLTVVSADASPGWVVVDTQGSGSANAEVRFQSADEVLEFTAERLEDGSVVTAVESSKASDDTDTTVGDTDTTTGDNNDDGDNDNADNDNADNDNADNDNADNDNADDNSGQSGDDNSGHGKADDCDDNSVTVCVDVEVDDD